MAIIKHKNQRVGIFIDTQNLYHSAKNLYRSKVNFGAVVKEALAGRILVRAVAYVCIQPKRNKHRINSYCIPIENLELCKNRVADRAGDRIAIDVLLDFELQRLRIKFPNAAISSIVVHAPDILKTFL